MDHGSDLAGVDVKVYRTRTCFAEAISIIIAMSYLIIVLHSLISNVMPQRGLMWIATTAPLPIRLTSFSIIETLIIVDWLSLYRPATKIDQLRLLDGRMITAFDLRGRTRVFSLDRFDWSISAIRAPFVRCEGEWFWIPVPVLAMTAAQKRELRALLKRI